MNQNLRTVKTETESLAPTRINAVDLLVVIGRSSNSFTREDKDQVKLLQDQSQAHLADRYLEGKPPKPIETITLDMSADHLSILSLIYIAFLRHTYRYIYSVFKRSRDKGRILDMITAQYKNQCSSLGI